MFLLIMVGHERSGVSDIFESFDIEGMLERPHIEWLIEDICPMKAIVLVHGQSGAGKSFIAIDVACSIAAGNPWHGHAVKQGPVLYIAAEGHAGLPVRIHAWLIGHGLTTKPYPIVRFFPNAIDPLNAKDITKLLLTIDALGVRPVLVIIDTWGASLGVSGGKEDSADDTNAALAAWRRVMATYGASVWIIHHQGHNEHGRARGSSALKQGADVEIMVWQDYNKIIHVENTKQRDALPFETLHMKLDGITLDGKSVSAMLLDSSAPTVEAINGLDATTVAILQVLVRAGIPYGEDFKGLTATEWEEAAGLEGHSRSNVKRIRKRLFAEAYVHQEGEGRGARYIPSMTDETEREDE